MGDGCSYAGVFGRCLDIKTTNLVSLTLTWVPSIQSHRLESHRFDGRTFFFVTSSTKMLWTKPGCVRPTYLRAASNVAWSSKVTIPAMDVAETFDNNVPVHIIARWSPRWIFNPFLDQLSNLWGAMLDRFISALAAALLSTDLKRSCSAKTCTDMSMSLVVIETKTTIVNVHAFSSFDGNCFWDCGQFLKGFAIGGKY